MPYPDFADQSLRELLSLEPKTAVVTGGGAGIGRAIAYRLAEAGATLVIGDLDAARAIETAASLPSTGAGHIGIELDVNDPMSIRALAEEAVRRTGRLDIWVNNAGVYPSSPVLDITDQDWSRVFDLNVRGTFVGAREAALRMPDGRGVIVNIVSTAAFNASNGANSAHYVASKHAVVGLTKSLAVELGDRGIRAVAIAPTLTETPGVAARREDAAVREALVQYGAALPLGRLGLPDDIARAVLFAASDLAAFVTGSVIAVDGGDLAR